MADSIAAVPGRDQSAGSMFQPSGMRRWRTSSSNSGGPHTPPGARNWVGQTPAARWIATEVRWISLRMCAAEP